MKWILSVLIIVSANIANAQSLTGSLGSMREQYNEGERLDLTRLKTPAEIRRFVKAGLLVEVRSNANFQLNEVSFPYTRPSVKLFIDRISRQYRAACDEKLVITSLTRPISKQPRNASNLSVHPSGMSVDFRRPANLKCRRWLEPNLLYLEKRGVLEATRERRPPHYHVAVYPTRYRAYVNSLTKRPAPPKRR